MSQEHQPKSKLKINNRSNDFNTLISKLDSTMVLSRSEKENVNVSTRAVQEDAMEMDSPKEKSVDTETGNNATDQPCSYLSESRVSQAITTLEALLKTGHHELDSNPQAKLLKRLKSTARQVVLRGIVSKRAQRTKIQELMATNDETISKKKGIRLLRGVKAAKVKADFRVRDSSEHTETPPLPSAPAPADMDSTPSSSSAPSPGGYNHKFECYVCKTHTHISHHFYDQMCCSCGELNYKKRTQRASLTGRVALVTGGRIKIGYETALILLRAGAHVVVTTRFPHDAAFRYSKEHDFEQWKHRLDIYGIDFRFLRMVEAFCSYMNEKYERLDILIQNAAQTIRRPVQYYKHLLEFEQLQLPGALQGLVKEFGTNQCGALPLSNPPAIECVESEPVQDLVSSAAPLTLSSCLPTSAAACSQILVHPEDSSTPQHLLPVGSFDEHHQQLDLRPENSWTLQFDQVDSTELVEVQLVNSIAPYILLSKLTPLMAKGRDRNEYGWIILVSSMEGKFTRPYKTTSHPHTNMAKAALNMTVRTSASYYKSKCNLLMNAVDTGWVTDEDPVPLQGKRPAKFHPPLDEVDGAARVLDPIFQTLNEGKIVFGAFLKDYTFSTW